MVRYPTLRHRYDKHRADHLLRRVLLTLREQRGLQLFRMGRGHVQQRLSRQSLRALCRLQHAHRIRRWGSQCLRDAAHTLADAVAHAFADAVAHVCADAVAHLFADAVA